MESIFTRTYSYFIRSEYKICGYHVPELRSCHFLVSSNLSLLEVVQLIEQQKLSALTVIRDNDVLVGILEKAAILSLLQRRILFNPA